MIQNKHTKQKLIEWLKSVNALYEKLNSCSSDHTYASDAIRVINGEKLKRFSRQELIDHYTDGIKDSKLHGINHNGEPWYDISLAVAEQLQK